MSILETIPRSVLLEKDHIVLLNQQLLPGKVQYEKLHTLQDVWEAIVSLKVRGAPAIGITAAFGLVLAADAIQTEHLTTLHVGIKKARNYLASSRPTAVNLFWALDRLVEASNEATTIEETREILRREALLIQKEDEDVCRQIGEHAVTLFEHGANILTHCNAGSIATARYGTALAPFYIAKERGITLRAFACETRPVLQGARLTAWELQQAEVDVTLITDNMAANTIASKNIAAIIVGADRVVANGDTANKIGTLSLAILAKHYNIPFYVAAPTSTFDLTLEHGNEIVIEERNEKEVTHVHGTRVAPIGVNVYNPAFDVTPGQLITAIITEKGIIRGDYSVEIQKHFQ
ncbi:S-methyl-5-thioribose-1-phosphate isomerase [Priestia taiwanensis]|uniref:Methylthioribose-1-phosphate isomerase n=1 Tax=Priestia taiwanensis TaxID=1347902 RepID=A0A917AR88_9BACI|nr:S-methyl-5-thioribose-1-phosphate isomerase [Priestia taiwanensis]MBM7363245.1 methylthioribose-1-phosphate isomerase [Priestia taiwanensis]GGE68865.1 methylthioribose-1-phosphate isomerase 2 [Priestia taiwanensis]